MENSQIVKELESLYRKFLKNGNIDKAQEVMTQIIQMQSVPESTEVPRQNILLG